MNVNFNLRETFLDKTEKALFFLLSLACAFIGFPSEMSVPALVAYIFFLIAFGGVVLFNNGFKCSRYEAGYISIILLFFLYGMMNSLISYGNGYDFRDWLVSMVIILSLFITIAMIFSGLKVTYILNVVILVSFLWTIKVMYSVLQVIPIKSLLGIRITGVEIDAVMPYPLVAAVLTLFYLCDKNKIYYVLYAWFCFFIVIVGYKAVMAVVGLATVVYFLGGKISVSKIIFLIAISGLFISFGLYDYVLVRFDSIGGDGDRIRIEEVSAALKLFESSPFYGVGLGFSIPNTETAGLTKTYIHNSFVYLITSIGLFGLLIYSAVVLGSCLNRGKLNYLTMLLFLFLIASLTSAAFKLFQFNYLLVILLFLNLKRNEINDK